MRYRDDPSRSLQQRVLSAVAAFPAFLIGPVRGPLIGSLAGQPQLRLIDEFQDGGQVIVSARLMARGSLSSADEVHHFFGHAVCGRGWYTTFQVLVALCVVSIDRSAIILRGSTFTFGMDWMAPSTDRLLKAEVASMGKASFWPLCRFELRCGDFADVNDELLPVDREYGDRYAHRVSVLVKGAAEDLEHGDSAVGR